jgi:tripartite-type tricarboxylate transporter receptor subunit TctC
MKRRCFARLAGMALALPATRAIAQGSGRPVRVIVPLPAGSSNDHAARVVSPALARVLGQPFVVDNKAGGNGIPATQEVIRAAPDGTTLFFPSNSPVAVNVALVRNLPYDPRRDLTPIAGINRTNHCLIVRSDFPANTFAEFVAHARGQPGRVSIGVSTTTAQMIVAAMNRQAGMELLAVTYRGTPATITDVLGGTLNATMVDPGNALAQVRGGRMKALAVTSGQRNPLVPDWPAVSETLPGFDFSVWNAILGPPGMARDLVERISNAVRQVLAEREVVDGLAAGGTFPHYLSPEQLKAQIEADIVKWTRAAREAGVQPE